MVRNKDTTPEQMADSIIWTIRDILTIRKSGFAYDDKLLKECVEPLYNAFIDLYLMNTEPDEDFNNYRFWMEVKNIFTKRFYYSK